MPYQIIIFAGLTLFILNGCTPSMGIKQSIEVQSGQRETIPIKDWRGENICVELTMDEPIFQDSINPEISLILSSNDNSKSARIGLMHVGRKSGNSLLHIDLEDSPDFPQDLQILPVNLKSPAFFEVEFETDSKLNITAHKRVNNFTLPFNVKKLEIGVTSSVGSYRYEIGC